MKKPQPLSREFLLNRGYCCKNGCTNCPYKINTMEDKYFTPAIEDIYVGYEYEYKTHDGVNYSKEEFDKLSWEKGIYGFNDFPYVERTMKGRMQFQTVRVPYLTKEQIEAEGWKDLGYPHSPIYTKNKFTLYCNDNYNIGIHEGVGHSWQLRYSGECKDINAFRTICKLLKIN